MGAADATFGKENYVNNILWDFTSESQVAFRLSHLDRPTLKYIAIGFWNSGEILGQGTLAYLIGIFL